ncbi:hypothetical protein K501DRAFT_337884 [Backusella circina FSU 941]|nr:hypothetical protein K501DRAFT_337884 [Backusella circina FSU 941]
MDPETPTEKDKETPIAHHELNSLDLAALQLHQLNAAQANALAEAAAAALGGATATESYQQLFTNFDSNTALAAAAAAALAAVNNETASTQANIGHLPSAEIIKRELMNQKVRADNRERKKRWRLQNEERNKDNDLRCRVNKRAHKLFGKEDSDHKRRWVTDEFAKRQQKRKEKERKRGFVDDSLSGHSYNTDSGLDLAALAQQLVAQQQQTTDANYLTLLCNNLGIPARSLLNNTTDEVKQEKNNQQQFPLQLLELLQQLQQYQQQEEQQPQKESTPEPSNFELPGNEDPKAEEKIAALIASTFQAVMSATAASTANNESEIKEENNIEEQQQQQVNNENNPQNAEFPMDAVLTLMQLNAGWRQ